MKKQDIQEHWTQQLQGSFLCLYGKGTKISKYLINHDKIYEAEIKLGKITDTLDREGNIVEEKEVDKKILLEENIKSTLKKFIGKQEQLPPMYSAIKVNGKKLYEYAREDKQVNIQPRQIEIYNIELMSINENENLISIMVHTSKGTYIRSLCRDIAESLGTIGYMNNLKRIRVRTI